MRKLGLLGFAAVAALLLPLVSTGQAATGEEIRARPPIELVGASSLVAEDVLVAHRAGESEVAFSLTGKSIRLERINCFFSCQPSEPGTSGDVFLTEGVVTLVELTDGFLLEGDKTGTAGATDAVLTTSSEAGVWGPAPELSAPSFDGAAAFTGQDGTVAAAVTGVVEGVFSGATLRYEGKGPEGAQSGTMDTRPSQFGVGTVHIRLTALEATASSTGEGVVGVHASQVGAKGARLTTDAGDERTFRGDVGLEILGIDRESGDDLIVVKVLAAPPIIPAAAPDNAEAATRGETVVTAGAAIVGLAAVAAAVWYWPSLRWLATLPLLPLYSRIQRGEIMEHETRERIYGLVKDNPGIHAHEIASRANVGWGTAVYHLKMLEDHRLVVSERQGRYKRFFLAAGFTGTKDAIGAMRNPTTASVAEFIARNPGCIQREVCVALGLSPSLVSWHIDKLEQADLVKKLREGRTVKYFAGPMWNAVAPQPVAVDVATAVNN